MHYFWFCHFMKWQDNLLLTGGGPDIAMRGQYQLAMYALHLSAGQSIYCKSIKVATIDRYLFAAATFIALFTGVDFRKDHPTDNHMGTILAAILRDLKKYESVPDRREPYDPQMHQAARLTAAQYNPNSLACALTDGFEQGYCAGYRLSEWAQPSRLSAPLAPQLNHLVDAPIRTRALVPDDFRILTTSRHRASGLAILRHELVHITKMWVKFRTQKNGQHGEEKLFARNPKLGGFCYVASVYRALTRFQRLSILDPRLRPNVTPLSVYWSTRTACVKLITADDIELYMRRLARQVYHLHPVRDAKDIARWSSHSLRVGACVALHAMGFSPLDIQWILRWRSLAFMVYLRNVAILAIRQFQALDKAAELPFL
jgi:hypothetical protein